MTKVPSVIVFCSGILIGSTAFAELVDFENAASFGGDDATITNDYFASYGLSVSAVAGNSKADASSAVLTFEAAGRDGTDGFWSATPSGRDEAISGDLGNYLVKAGGGDLAYNKSKYFNMSLQYDNATSAASGEVWDIDGKEQYKVTALDANGNAIASLTSPVGSLDGEPWTWSFDMGDEASIAQIDVEFVSTQSTLRGFAFDNFNSTQANPEATAHAAPIPHAFSMGAACLIGLVANRSRRRKNA